MSGTKYSIATKEMEIKDMKNRPIAQSIEQIPTTANFKTIMTIFIIINSSFSFFIK